MDYVKRTICILLCLGAFTLVQSQNTIFDLKRREYMRTEGTTLHYYPERIWAWLEKIKTGEINRDTYYVKDRDGVSKPVKTVIHNIITAWGSPWSLETQGWPPYINAWCFGPWQEHVMLIWILLGYGDVIDVNDRNFLNNLYDGNAKSRDICAGSPNTQISDFVGRYLYCQDHKDYNVIYSYNPPDNNNIIQFSYEGRNYIPGNRYNAFELYRDWLNYTIRKWIKDGNRELVSPIYSWTFVHGFSALHQFSKDPLMKRKAKMMVDFLLLDSGMDFSGNQWGGSLGRSYAEVFTIGRCRYYWDIFWDMRPSTEEPSRNIFVSSYRIPDVIQDAVDISDEPDNYYHINTELNTGICYNQKAGKWTYATKFYNLGGSRGNNWQLAVQSNDAPGMDAPGLPFYLWINNVSGRGITSPDFGSYIDRGKTGYQYKNAVWALGSIFHSEIGPNRFDQDVTIGNCRFLVEGRTMIAVLLNNTAGAGGLEVAVQGVDYQSLTEFKNAVMSNASIDGYHFTNSHGETIARSWDSKINDFMDVIKKRGQTEYQPVWNFPFPRIQTVDYRGQYIVRWLGDKMIVAKHGKQLTYDFANWTITESVAVVDTEAPTTPVGISIRTGN